MGDESPLLDSCTWPGTRASATDVVTMVYSHSSCSLVKPGRWGGINVRSTIVRFVTGGPGRSVTTGQPAAYPPMGLLHLRHL